MISNIIESIFGSKNAREVKKLMALVGKINSLEAVISAKSDAELQGYTNIFRDRLKKGETLDDILEEAFAVVREVSKRVLGLRHYDVQMIGGVALHRGRIAEMATGEGKTLTATLAVYLNALAGSVHVVTVNDYLAGRDSAWMGKIYEFLGMKVGHLKRDDHHSKQEVYSSDIVYGTNNEFGFDYLRDRMVVREDELMQGALNYAIIDEVDSILIDEARTPLIISGESKDDISLYTKVQRLIKSLTRQEYVEKIKNVLLDELEFADDTGDFMIDEKQRSVYITDLGHEKVERLLASEGLLKAGDNLYDYTNSSLLHHVNIAIKANHIFKRDVDYVVFEGKVIIIDEHTGRAMPGRRWSEGIHQAIEAKEAVPIQKESQTLASTTFQNYFRLYKKIAGMTGTAKTEEKEFNSIYNIDLLTIPPNRPSQRKDHNDYIYLTKDEKHEAILEQVLKCREKQQPILIGTASIEHSEVLSKLLTKKGISHQVLNAKHHDKESYIISQAGRLGAITIATNMAGRGTDIVLGGNIDEELKDCAVEEVEALKSKWSEQNAKVREAGGLFVLGAERHEARRIDNQLIGRSGRQGDPGESRFYLSLEDDMIRIFASEKILNMMKGLGFERGEVIEHRLITSSIERAQKRIESHNFEVRKQLVDFDDINNEQRKVLYSYREDVLFSKSVLSSIEHIADDYLSTLPEAEAADDVVLLFKEASEMFDFRFPLDSYYLDERLDKEKLTADLKLHFTSKLGELKDSFGENTEAILKMIFLQIIDKSWREHLTYMEVLRQGMHFRGYAQKDPKQEYKRESFVMFSNMIDRNSKSFIRAVVYTRNAELKQIEAKDIKNVSTNEDTIKETTSALAVGTGSQDQRPKSAPIVREMPKVGRNEDCPCGSGKKYKHCHGR